MTGQMRLRLWGSVDRYYSFARTGSDNLRALHELTTAADAPDAADVVYIHGEPSNLVRLLERAPIIAEKYVIGFYVWETSLLPAARAALLEPVDEIWTASTYCHEILSRYHDNVHWIPHIVSPPLACTGEQLAAMRGLLQTRPDSFYFFTIGRLGDGRKNLRALEEAFSKVAAQLPNTYLVIKNVDISRGSEDSVSVVHEGRKIIISGHLSRGQIDALYACGDAYVSAHCSEGWGLPLSDAMILGKPVIASAYSGNLDFMTPANSFLVKCTEDFIRPSTDYQRVEPGMRWGYVEVDSLVEQMVLAYRMRQDGSLPAKTQAAQRDMQNYDAAHVQALMQQRLQHIAAHVSPTPAPRRWAARQKISTEAGLPAVGNSAGKARWLVTLPEGQPADVMVRASAFLCALACTEDVVLTNPGLNDGAWRGNLEDEARYIMQVPQRGRTHGPLDVSALAQDPSKIRPVRAVYLTASPKVAPAPHPNTDLVWLAAPAQPSPAGYSATFAFDARATQGMHRLPLAVHAIFATAPRPSRAVLVISRGDRHIDRATVSALRGCHVEHIVLFNPYLTVPDTWQEVSVTHVGPCAAADRAQAFAMAGAVMVAYPDPGVEDYFLLEARKLGLVVLADWVPATTWDAKALQTALARWHAGAAPAAPPQFASWPEVAARFVNRAPLTLEALTQAELYGLPHGEIRHWASANLPAHVPERLTLPRVTLLSAGPQAQLDAPLRAFLVSADHIVLCNPERVPSLNTALAAALLGRRYQVLFDVAADLPRALQRYNGAFQLDVVHVCDTPERVDRLRSLCQTLATVLRSEALRQQASLPTLLVRSRKPDARQLSADGAFGARVAHALIASGLARAAGDLPILWMDPEGSAASTLESSRLYFYPYTDVRGLNHDEIDVPLLPQLLEQGRIQLMLQLSPLLASFLAVRARHARQTVPVVGMLHSLHGANMVSELILQGLESAHSEVDCIISPTECGARAYTMLVNQVNAWLAPRLGRDTAIERDIAVIPYGIDTETYGGLHALSCRQSLGLPANRPIILCFGRMRRQEKADLLPLLLALQPLLGAFPELFLVIAGGDLDSQYTTVLNQAADALGMQNHLRLVSNPAVIEKPLYYGAADIAVALADNVQETYGLAVLEAMAAGLPVVAADWDGFREIVRHGETGFLVPTTWSTTLDTESALQRVAEGALGYGYRDLHESVVTDLPALVDALRALLQDPALRLRLGQRGREVCRAHHDQRAQSQKMIDLCLQRVERAASCPWSPPPWQSFVDPVATRFAHYATHALGEDAWLVTTEAGMDLLQRTRIQQFAGIVDKRGKAILEHIVQLCHAPHRCGAVEADLARQWRGSPSGMRRHVLRAMKFGLLKLAEKPPAC